MMSASVMPAAVGSAATNEDVRPPIASNPRSKAMLLTLVSTPFVSESCDSSGAASCEDVVPLEGVTGGAASFGFFHIKLDRAGREPLEPAETPKWPDSG